MNLNGIFTINSLSRFVIWPDNSYLQLCDFIMQTISSFACCSKFFCGSFCFAVCLQVTEKSIMGIKSKWKIKKWDYLSHMKKLQYTYFWQILLKLWDLAFVMFSRLKIMSSNVNCFYLNDTVFMLLYEWYY